MFPKTYCNIKQQAGDALLDALLAMVIAAIIGLGAVYASAKAAVAQQQTLFHQLATNALNARLQQDARKAADDNTRFSNQCSANAQGATTTAITILGQTLNVAVNCVDLGETITLQGNAVNNPNRWIVSLSVQSSLLGKEGSTLNISQHYPNQAQ